MTLLTTAINPVRKLSQECGAIQKRRNCSRADALVMILFREFSKCREPDGYKVFSAHAFIDEKPNRSQLETLRDLFREEGEFGSSIRTRIELILG